MYMHIHLHTFHFLYLFLSLPLLCFYMYMYTCTLYVTVSQVKSSSSKAKSGGGSVKKAPPRSSPLASAPRSQDPSPLSKVLYDYSHSPTAQITAVTLSPSKTGSAGLSREGGGASPRKFGGLYKAQKPGAKLSKSAHQKLRESLKIFDFSSDSESEDEGVTPVKKPAKPKARPPIDLETGEGMEVKDHDKTPPPKPKTNSNYRYMCTCVHVH